MFNQNTEKENEEVTPEEKLFEEQKEQWADLLARLAVNGEPFFTNGFFTMRISTETEIIDIGISRTPNNIIPFPVKAKQELPKVI